MFLTCNRRSFFTLKLGGITNLFFFNLLGSSAIFFISKVGLRARLTTLIRRGNDVASLLFFTFLIRFGIGFDNILLELLIHFNDRLLSHRSHKVYGKSTRHRIGVMKPYRRRYARRLELRLSHSSLGKNVKEILLSELGGSLIV